MARSGKGLSMGCPEGPQSAPERPDPSGHLPPSRLRRDEFRVALRGLPRLKVRHDASPAKASDKVLITSQCIGDRRTSYTHRYAERGT